MKVGHLVTPFLTIELLWNRRLGICTGNRNKPRKRSESRYIPQIVTYIENECNNLKSINYKPRDLLSLKF